MSLNLLGRFRISIFTVISIRHFHRNICIVIVHSVIIPNKILLLFRMSVFPSYLCDVLKGVNCFPEGKKTKTEDSFPVFQFNNLKHLLTYRTNVASVGSVFNDTRKVKVLSLPETIKEKSTFRAKALRRFERRPFVGSY